MSLNCKYDPIRGVREGLDLDIFKDGEGGDIISFMVMYMFMFIIMRCYNIIGVCLYSGRHEIQLRRKSIFFIICNNFK